MKRTYPVSVRLLSAMHINGGTDINDNRITVRTDGKAYIPASLFKGIVRENFTKLWQIAGDDSTVCTGNRNEARQCRCTVCRMFGTAGFQRSRIFFDHLETEQSPCYQMRGSVSVNRYTRKSADRTAVFTEIVEPLAEGENGRLEPCIFHGEITIYYPPEYTADQQKQIEAVFVQAVRMMTEIGSGISRGLGFTETEIGAPEGGWICENE